jgi:hypothetical protein
MDKKQETLWQFAVMFSAIIFLCSIIWLFISLINLRSLPEDAKLPTVAGTAQSVRDDSRHGKNGLIREATITVDVGEGRKRYVLMGACDDRTFPIVAVSGQKILAMYHGTRLIGLRLGNSQCYDATRYRKRHAQDREAANTGIPLSILGVVLGCIGLWGGISRLNKLAP